MSHICENVKSIKNNLNQLVDSVGNGAASDAELKDIFDLLHRMSKAKTEIESHAVSFQKGQQIARCFDLKNYDIRKVRNKKITTQYTKVMPPALEKYDPAVDTLYSADTICSELIIAYPTFDAWRRNWRSDRSQIAFPPPVIYVYDSPRWTLRQLQWWLEAYKGKVYIKGLNNDSTGNK